MEVMEGYKQTDMGLIPLEWDVKEFEEVMDGFSSGQTPYRAIANYYKGDIPWVTSGELNYNVITDTIEKISIEGVRAASLKMIPKGTFLFAITGLEAAGTRGSCAITGIEVTTNQSCMALYPKKNLLITPYLYHYYVKFGNELAFEYCQGTKQQSYTGVIAKKLPIIVPPSIKEQTSIAAALSDADALITSLENLIEKKRAIKQGAMQELLRPKEGWKIEPIKNIAEISTGAKNTQDKLDEGIYPFFVRSQNIERINSYSYDGEAVLVAGDGVGTGKVVHYFNGKFDFHQRVYKISHFQEKLVGFYFYLYFKNNFYNRIMQMTAKSSVDSVRLEMISEMIIPFPSIAEQTHIATILGEMDHEISLIEQKLSKYKMLKQGMMQELLTGKIRVI